MLDATTPPAVFRQAAAKLPHGARWVGSDYPRTVETAQKLRALLGPVPAWLGQWLTVDAAFAEQDFGTWVGQQQNLLLNADPVFAQIRGQVGDWYHLRPPGGESFQELVQRVGRGLEKLAREQSGEQECGRDAPDPKEPGAPVVVVCHGGTLRAALVYGGAYTAQEVMDVNVPYLSVLRMARTERAGHTPGWCAEWVEEPLIAACVCASPDIIEREAASLPMRGSSLPSDLQVRQSHARIPSLA